MASCEALLMLFSNPSILIFKVRIVSIKILFSQSRITVCRRSQLGAKFYSGFSNWAGLPSVNQTVPSSFSRTVTLTCNELAPYQSSVLSSRISGASYILAPAAY